MPPTTATEKTTEQAPTAVVEVKQLEGIEIKNDDKGEIEAVIATLGVVDKDRDIIRKDAIPNGSRVKISDYGHSAVFGAPPVGKGVLKIKGDKVIFEGKYFMSTTDGANAFRRMKEIGTEDQEWSFGFNVKGAEMPEDKDRERGAWRILTKLDSFEVSPVLRGAGIVTRTLAVKAASQGALEHKSSAESAETQEAEAKRLADEETARKKAEDEAEEARKAAEQKAAGEAAAKAKADEADAKLKAAEARVAELETALADAKKTVADEADAKRKAEEAEAKRIADEAEAERLAAVKEQEAKTAAVRLQSTLEFERFQRTMQRPFARG